MAVVKNKVPWLCNSENTIKRKNIQINQKVNVWEKTYQVLQKENMLSHWILGSMGRHKQDSKDEINRMVIVLRAHSWSDPRIVLAPGHSLNYSLHSQLFWNQDLLLVLILLWEKNTCKCYKKVFGMGRAIYEKYLNK